MNIFFLNGCRLLDWFFGSGSAWIGIDLTLLDPDLKLFKMAFLCTVPRYRPVCFMAYYVGIRTAHKVPTLFMSKSDFLWRQSLIRIQIRMDSRWFGSLYPDPDPNPHWGKRLDPDPDSHWNQCESESLLKVKTNVFRWWVNGQPFPIKLKNH